MKKLLLLILPLLLMSATPSNEGEVDIRFFGVWRSLDGEFIQISRQDDFSVSFYRIEGKTRMMQARGIIEQTEEGLMEIKRQLPSQDEYTLKYHFSPSGETMVVMKPYEPNRAWVFERIQ